MSFSVLGQRDAENPLEFQTGDEFLVGGQIGNAKTLANWKKFYNANKGHLVPGFSFRILRMKASIEQAVMAVWLAS